MFLSVKGAGGNGQVYFGAYSGDRGVIYRWKVGSTDSPAVAMELTHGLVPTAVDWYQGGLVVRAKRARATTGSQAVLLRCPVEDTTGNARPFFVTEIGSATTTDDNGTGAFAANERNIYFSWLKQDGSISGIGAYNIDSGGYAKWFKGTSGSGLVRSIVIWQGRVGFTVDGVGFMLESASTYVTTGSITTSIADKASTLDKIYDQFTLVSLATAAGESISVEASLDGGVSFATVTGATLDTAGSRTKTVAYARKANSAQFRVTLAGPGTSSPSLLVAQLRLHQHGLADAVVQLPINCFDFVSDLNNRPLPDSGPGKGAARARNLEALAQSRIKLQDIDWVWTKTAEIYEVAAVRVRSTLVKDPKGKVSIGQIAMVTARKVAK